MERRIAKKTLRPLVTAVLAVLFPGTHSWAAAVAAAKAVAGGGGAPMRIPAIMPGISPAMLQPGIFTSGGLSFSAPDEGTQVPAVFPVPAALPAPGVSGEGVALPLPTEGALPAPFAAPVGSAWRERADPFDPSEWNGGDYISARYGYGYRSDLTLAWLRVVGAERFLNDVARDPAVMRNLPEFVGFFKSHALPSTYDEARELVSRHLGEATVYRGVALLPEEAEALRREGVRAKAGRAAGRPSDLKNDLTMAFRDHLLHNGDNIPDVFISVTSHWDVAAAVAADYARDGRAVYLLEIRVPRLDLIRPAHGAFASFYPWAPEAMHIVVLHPDGSRAFRRLDADSESVLTYRILPGEIVSMRRIDAPPRIDGMDAD